MPKYKNYSKNGMNADLKNADSEKNTENGVQHLNAELFLPKARVATTHKKKDGARKKLPIAVDIIISILMIAIAIGVFAGTYYLYRYFTVDYENVTVEYKLLIENTDTESYSGVLNKHVYMDIEGNTVYFGKIIGIDAYEGQNAVILKIALNAKFKAEEGYFAGNSKIAVGSSYNLRTESKAISGVIVELEKKSAPKKANSILYVDSARFALSLMGGVD